MACNHSKTTGHTRCDSARACNSQSELVTIRGNYVVCGCSVPEMDMRMQHRKVLLLMMCG